MALNARHLLERVIRPTLKGLGERYGGRAAEQLVLATAAYESGLRELVQLGSGPALGLWQMEPETHDSLHRDLLDKRPELRLRVMALLSATNQAKIPDSRELIWNLAYGAAMCRLRYLWDPHPLPLPDDAHGMAVVYKRAYNTRLGRGTEEGFVRAWRQYLAPVLGPPKYKGLA